MASRRVLELINAADTDSISAGDAKDFRNASASATTNVKNRVTRIRVLAKALRGEAPSL
jgi:hypothetical protein